MKAVRYDRYGEADVMHSEDTSSGPVWAPARFETAKDGASGVR